MDIRIEERALAPVGEKAVQLAHAGGLEIRRLLEQFRDLQEIGAHEGNPVVEKHVEPPAGPTARRLAARESPQCADQPALRAAADAAGSTGSGRTPGAGAFRAGRSPGGRFNVGDPHA